MSVDLGDVPEALRGPASAALAAAGVKEGHLSVALVDSGAIRALNREHRDRDRPTDVLAFPIDGGDASPGPRELGDVVVCAEQATNVVEAVVHGVLHLCGYDHERDDGEMLTLQARVMADLATASPGVGR